MGNEIWSIITTSVKIGQRLELLYMQKNSQAFIIDEIDSGYIKVKFVDSKRYLRFDESRFISAWNFLEKNKTSWVKIGSSRKYTKTDTLEGIIKKEFDNNMNGLATATWIAAILEKVFRNIEFNGKARGQAIRLID